MRKALLAVLMMVAMTGAISARAQQPMSKDERAYTITLICAAIAANDRDDAGSQRSIEAARKMAAALGYSSKKLSSDLITMASVVGVQLRDEPAKVEQRRGICRQLGLLS
jgi:hypothetical protein